MERHAFFVTGSDTGIGKTWISRLLCDAFAGRGAVSYLKAVQTGCIPDQSGFLYAPDLDYVLQGGAVMTHDYATHVPFRFEPACSPHLAAEMAQTAIDPEHIVRCVDQVFARTETLIIEGAGGLLVPLSRSFYMINLIERLDFPVVLVTSARLGTLNHTFLSIESIERRGLRLAGAVINTVADLPMDFIYHDNIRTIRKRVAPRPCIELQYNQSNTEHIQVFCDAITN